MNCAMTTLLLRDHLNNAMKTPLTNAALYDLQKSFYRGNGGHQPS